MIPRLILCTGNRTWTDRARVAAELASFAPPAHIMHGAARGLDSLVDEVALRLGHAPDVTLHRRPADWTEYRRSGGKRGKDAGPRRNEAMAEEARAGLLERRWSAVQGLAFGILTKPDGGDTGTGGMVRLMRARGWPVLHVPAPEAPAQVLALHVYTASLKRPGIFDEPDLLDVTRGTGGARGSPFAPSWSILQPALAKLRQGGSVAEGGWAEYVPAYIGEMRVSYRTNPEAWTNLLALPRVVIACHCPPGAAASGWCHRFLLGQRILPALGAVYEGELPPAPARQPRLPGLE